MRNIKRTRKLALSAVLCAFGTLILYFGAVIDVMFLSMAAVCSVLVIYAVIEIGGFYPWMIYLATSILSLLLLPNKLPALAYFLFFGIFPLVKSYAERLPVVLAFLLKLAAFNAGLTLFLLVTQFVIGLQDLTFGFSPAVYIGGNVIFILFDYVLTGMITLYQKKLRKWFGKPRFFGS